MNKSFTAEWKSIIRNRKLLIPIIAVLFIPILYSGMFLWAFWDPYEQLDDLPVAIVNEDKGADYNGEQLHLGEDLTDKLKESKQFNFRFVDKDTGYDHLKKQDYYLLVEIPENFSENATTLLDEHPQKLELKYVPNESYNFLSAQIGETAMERIKASLSEKITETYAESVFDKVSEMADGYGTASDNAGKLYDGIQELTNGSKTLEENLQVLASKQIEFKNGVEQIDSGSKKMGKGTSELADGLGRLDAAHEKLEAGSIKIEQGLESASSGSEQLSTGLQSAYSSMNAMINGTEQIQAGANQLSGNLTAWANEANKASMGAENVKNGVALLQKQLQPYMAELPEDKQKELTAALSQIIAGSTQLSSGTGELAAAANQLASGASTLDGKIGELAQGEKQLQAGLGRLTEGSEQLSSGISQLDNGQKEYINNFKVFGTKLGEASNGASKLANGASELSNGMDALKNGSVQLADGSKKLADGSEKLVSGSSKVEEGSKEFKDKLGEAAEKAQSVHPNEDNFNMMAGPVKVDKEPVTEVPNYGTGFAPYFLSLGLFVGALLLSIVYPLRDPSVAPKNGVSWFFSKYGVMAIVGIIQALIASGILLIGLGIEVQSVPLFILFSIITSLSFIALIQFLVTTLGDPGRFVAIIVLILQLTTSAGTFPLELIPKPLQMFNAFLPMTYSVQGYKDVISSGSFAGMWHNAWILLSFMAVFMVGTLLYFVFKFNRSEFKMDKHEGAIE
ncbi:YhgE/Pip domain-containing protein [Peribacillus acanthi]|uniref:YhgE/Pip domain-containing protein n=1 Tax=Peribacillus acanthi TaxID=2171554 RepID=UPI000D3E77BB|nr:YhgE/Pip domain-containing protein [Peribacillus acanthi]